MFSSWMRCVAAVVIAMAAAAPAAAQTASLGASFGTLTIANSGFIPPDTMGSVGPNHFSQLINGAFRIYNKDGTAATSVTSDTSFWSSAGQAGAAGDNRILFDPITNRWFAAAFTGETSNNKILVARSNTADPTAGWKAVMVNPGGGLFYDFPTMGFDRNGLYVGTNNFNTGTLGAGLFIFPKADLLLTTPTAANATLTFSNISATVFTFIPQGVVNFDLGQAANAPGQIYGVDNEAFNKVNRFNVNGPSAAGATLGAVTDITVAATSFAPNSRQPNAAGTAVSTALIEASDDRFGSNVYRIGNLIYSVHSIAVSTKGAVRLTILNATTSALVAEGTLNEASYDLSYPSIAANANGDFVIGYSKSGFVASGSAANRYAGAYATTGKLTGTTIAFGSQMELTQGVAEYTLTFGSGRVRWGDYSATTLDPTDPGIFWTNQEFASAGNNWATQASEIIPTVANELRWRNAAAGNFTNAASWFNGVVPGTTDHALFSRNGNGVASYAVTFPAATTTTNDRASVRQGNVVWSIPSGATYALTNAGTGTSDTTGAVTSPASLAVGDYLGTARLTVSGGGTLTTVTTTIAARLNSEGATSNTASLTVTGAGTTWTNSGSVYVGGNASATGGTGTLTIDGGATATVGGTLHLRTSGSAVNVGSATTVGSLTVGGLTNPAGSTPTVTLANTASLLRVMGTASPAYTGTVNVGGKLDGTGTVGGTTNLLAGGTLQGGTGASVPATNTLALAGNLVLDGANAVRLVVGDTNPNGAADTQNSLITLGAGTLNRNTGGAATDMTTITIVNDGTLEPGLTYTVQVLTYTARANLVDTNFTIGAPEGLTGFTAASLIFTDTALSVSFTTPVPEPGLILGSLVALGCVVARRKRSA